MDSNGRRSGEAFVHFTKGEDADKALERNKQNIGHRWGKRRSLREDHLRLEGGISTSLVGHSSSLGRAGSGVCKGRSSNSNERGTMMMMIKLGWWSQGIFYHREYGTRNFYTSTNGITSTQYFFLLSVTS